MTSAISHDLWRFDPEGYHRWNMLGERAMHFYAERARGGFALLTAGQAMVHRSCGTNRPAAYLEQCVTEYRPITDAIHAHGAKVFMQLNHNGRGRISGTDDWDPVITVKPGPSFYPGAGGELTKEIDRAELRDIQRGWALSARHMELAGFDGIEVQAAHSYLISEFLTPAFNQRSDEYGGSLVNRMRFLREVLQGVREAVSDRIAVGIRLNSSWNIPNGFTIDDAIEVAGRLQQDDLIDFVNVSAWGYEQSLAGMGSPYGPLAPNAARIRAAIDADKTKVFVVGRIVDPHQAEQILADASADMVVLARQSIADPEWPNKARAGDVDDIVTCIGASQGCIGRHFQHLPITCTQNPTVGREAELSLSLLTRTEAAKRVVVIGGGPAGLEAAVIAARRGHEVVLCESEPRLGGQVNVITRAERRRDFANVIDVRARQLDKLGVEVRLSTTVDVAQVRALAPDVVIVATGSAAVTAAGFPADHRSLNAPDGIAIPGASLPHVLSSTDVLIGGRADHARHVVIFDNVGYYQSSDPLEYLVDRGVQVTGITPLGQFAIDMIYNDRPWFLDKIRGKAVDFHVFCSLTRIEPETVAVHNHETGRTFTIDRVDTVVLSHGNAPRNALYYDLVDAFGTGGPVIHRIGDCITPRRVEHAVFEGHSVGRSI